MLLSAEIPSFVINTDNRIVSTGCRLCLLNQAAKKDIIKPKINIITRIIYNIVTASSTVIGTSSLCLMLLHNKSHNISI